MKKIKTLTVLSFMGLLSFGVASCFNSTGPKGTGSGDTVRHDTTTHVRDTTHHHHIGTDTLIRHDTIKPPPPPPPPPPPDSGGLDSTTLDSLIGHH